jgi:hypothetical protein
VQKETKPLARRRESEEEKRESRRIWVNIMLLVLTKFDSKKRFFDISDSFEVDNRVDERKFYNQDTEPRPSN